MIKVLVTLAKDVPVRAVSNAPSLLWSKVAGIEMTDVHY
jgi:hypothetical protein